MEKEKSIILNITSPLKNFKFKFEAHGKNFSELKRAIAAKL